jgi:hypothetical protein
MTERLDRFEAGLEETRKLVESNARAILALATKSAELDATVERTSAAVDRLTVTVERTSVTVDRLANIVLRVYNRQDDHEDRITRLEQE